MVGKLPQNKQVNYAFFKRIFQDYFLEGLMRDHYEHFHPHDHEEYKHLDAEGVVVLFEDFNDFCIENLNFPADSYEVMCSFQLSDEENFTFKTLDMNEKITQIKIIKRQPPAIYVALVRRFVATRLEEIHLKKLHPFFKTRHGYNQYLSLTINEDNECYKTFKLSTHC